MSKHLKLLAVVEDDHKAIPSTIIESIDGTWYCNNEAIIKLDDDFSMPTEAIEELHDVLHKFIYMILEDVRKKSNE